MTSHSPMHSLERIVRRIIIWCLIPWRIVQELYLVLVDVPEVKGAGRAHDHATDASIDRSQKKLWEEEAEMNHWWSDNSPLAGLRNLNKIRIRLVAEAYLKRMRGLDDTWEEVIRSDAQFLTGSDVCDVGCGGGFLSEALADAGATVTGVDMVPAAIGIAKRHWLEGDHGTSPTPEYVCKSVEALAKEREGRYDVVICSEVLEHVTEPEVFALHCCNLVRPGGHIIFTTVNRTIWSLLFTIILCEDVLGLIPRFLHRLHMCVKPEEVEQAVQLKNFNVVKTTGLAILPGGFSAKDFQWVTWKWTGLNFIVIAQRPE